MENGEHDFYKRLILATAFHCGFKLVVKPPLEGRGMFALAALLFEPYFFKTIYY